RYTVSSSGGRIRSIVDPLGHRTSLAYDGSNNIQRIQDVSGRITSLTVEGSGNLTRIQTPDGVRTSLSYDGSHRLTAATNALGQRTTFQNTSGVLQSVISPLGERTSFAIYAQPHLLKAAHVRIDPRGQRTTLLHVGGGTQPPIAVQDALGNRTTYSWSGGRLQ